MYATRILTLIEKQTWATQVRKNTVKRKLGTPHIPNYSSYRNL